MTTNKKKIEESNTRFEMLRRATLLKYLEDIDLSASSIDLYDKMISHFVLGDLDDDFLAPSLLGIEPVKKRKIFDLAHQYISFCFYRGNHEYWSDSVEGVPLDDVELICTKIFDNFNFLVSLIKESGTSALEQIKKFKNMDGYKDSSLIEHLRNNFLSDDLLIKIIVKIDSDDFSIFTDEQKGLLCESPEGLLYFVLGDNILVSSAKSLIKEINRRYAGNYNEVATTLFRDLSNLDIFSNIITDMWMDYYKFKGETINDYSADFHELDKKIIFDDDYIYWNSSDFSKHSK